jgi:hypothetical protein
MGQAKRRQSSPDYGTPAVYILCVFDEHDEPLTEIPLPIKRRGYVKDTNKDALGLAGAILGYFIDPTLRKWVVLEEAIKRYTSGLAATIDLATLKELAGLLPEKFWAWVTDPDGQQVISTDAATENACIVMFASRQGVAPKQAGVEFRNHQQEDFVRQIR